MNYWTFREELESNNFSVFDTKELKTIFPGFNRSVLNNIRNWEKEGKLIKLRKGLYTFSHNKKTIEPKFLASKIHYPSYISLESALSYFGIIPEVVFAVTSVTSRKTKKLQNELAVFFYSKVKKKAFRGFVTIFKKEFGTSYNMATAEKALVDFFYLNRNILDASFDCFESYRLSRDFNYKKKKLLDFAKDFDNRKTLALTNKFIDYVA